MWTVVPSPLAVWVRHSHKGGGGARPAELLTAWLQAVGEMNRTWRAGKLPGRCRAGRRYNPNRMCVCVVFVYYACVFCLLVYHQGSEGYFMPDPETNAHLLNPGAGAQCEGE